MHILLYCSKTIRQWMICRHGQYYQLIVAYPRYSSTSLYVDWFNKCQYRNVYSNFETVFQLKISPTSFYLTVNWHVLTFFKPFKYFALICLTIQLLVGLNRWLFTHPLALFNNLDILPYVMYTCLVNKNISSL